MRLGGPVEGELGGDRQLDLAARGKPEGVGGEGAQRPGVVLGEGEDGEAADGESARVELGLADLPGCGSAGVAVGDEAAVARERVQAAAEGVAADGVEGEVDSAAAGGTEHVLGEAVADEHLVVAVLEGFRGLFGAGDDAVDGAGSGEPGDLGGNGSDAAGRALDEYGLPGAQPADLVDEPLDRGQDGRQGGGGAQGDALGECEDGRGGGDGDLGVTAVRGEGGDLLSGAQARDSGADGPDAAGDLEAGAEGQGRDPVAVGPGQDVGEVDSGVGDVDGHLAVGRLRYGDLGGVEDLGSAELVELDCVHGCTPG